MQSRYVRKTGDARNPVQDISVESLGDDRWAVTIDGTRHEVDAFPTDGGVHVRRDGQGHDWSVERRGEELLLRAGARREAHALLDHRTWTLQAAMGAGRTVTRPRLDSPMAGKVVLVRAQEGDAVERGQTLLIIEAMKMENEIRADGSARIKAIRVVAGQLVNPGDILLEFEVEDA